MLTREVLVLSFTAERLAYLTLNLSTVFRKRSIGLTACAGFCKRWFVRKTTSNLSSRMRTLIT
jgi:hypothetical protein